MHEFREVIGKPNRRAEITAIIDKVELMIQSRKKRPPLPVFNHDTRATKIEIDEMIDLFQNVDNLIRVVLDHHELVSDVLVTLHTIVKGIKPDSLKEALNGCPAPSSAQPFKSLDNFPGLWQEGVLPFCLQFSICVDVVGFCVCLAAVVLEAVATIAAGRGMWRKVLGTVPCRKEPIEIDGEIEAMVVAFDIEKMFSEVVDHIRDHLSKMTTTFTRRVSICSHFVCLSRFLRLKNISALIATDTI